VQAPELAAVLESKHQLSFDASVQPDFILFRGADNPNLGHWPLMVRCPAALPMASPSQHCCCDTPHHTLLAIMSTAISNTNQVAYHLLLVLPGVHWCLEQVKQAKTAWGAWAEGSRSVHVQSTSLLIHLGMVTTDRTHDMGSEDVGGRTWKTLPSNFHTHPHSCRD